MKVKINGALIADSSLDYDRIHRIVNDNTYDSIGDAILSKLSDAAHHSEWYQYTPQKFDLVENFNEVKAICDDNLDCYADSLNWSIMNKTELTSDIWKFIAHRMNIIREGFADNFLPKHGALDFIDWHFLLDCVSWFF